MNVKRRRPVSALSVAARIPGEATNALAVGIFCISWNMIPVSVSLASSFMNHIFMLRSWLHTIMLV